MSFPSNPTVGQQHEVAGRTYVWSGKVWNAVGTYSDQPLNTTDDVRFNSVTFGDGTTQETAASGGGTPEIIDGGELSCVAPDAPLVVEAALVNGTPYVYVYLAPNGGCPITSYKLYLGETLIGTVAAPEPNVEGYVVFTDTSLTVGQSVQVAAVNSVGESPKSNNVTTF